MVRQRDTPIYQGQDLDQCQELEKAKDFPQELDQDQLLELALHRLIILIF